MPTKAAARRFSFADKVLLIGTLVVLVGLGATGVFVRAAGATRPPSGATATSSYSRDEFKRWSTVSIMFTQANSDGQANMSLLCGFETAWPTERFSVSTFSLLGIVRRVGSTIDVDRLDSGPAAAGETVLDFLVDGQRISPTSDRMTIGWVHSISGKDLLAIARGKDVRYKATWCSVVFVLPESVKAHILDTAARWDAGKLHTLPRD